MRDAADHAAVIDAGLAARVRGKVSLKPRKLRIAQPE
jgi:hypothetical protein